MSYSPTRPVSGLGYTLTIGTPIGDQKITIPIETLVNDVAKLSMDALFPIALDKLKAEIPNLMGMAWGAAKPYFEEEKSKIVTEADSFMKKASTKVDSTVKTTTNTAFALVGMLIVGGAGLVIISKMKTRRQSAAVAAKV